MSDSLLQPKLKMIIANDWPVFLMVFLPIIFSIIILSVYVNEEYPFVGFHFYDFINAFLLISMLAFCMWPFVLWWYYRISKVYKKNIIIDATLMNNLGSDIVAALYINIEYEFEYNGKHFRHHVSLLPTSITKSVLKNNIIQIYFDPVSNISFIKSVYNN